MDFRRGVIQVRETYSEETGFGTPKTKSSARDVPMSEPVRAALVAHRSCCPNSGAEGLVFTSSARTPINSKNLARRILRPACVRLGLPPISWHCLRHSTATWLSESGATLRAAQDVLGQSDLETTLRTYTHVVAESQRRAVSKVAALLFPSVPSRDQEQEDAPELVR